MTDTVYVVMGGDADTSSPEQLFRIYHHVDDGLAYAIECMNEVWVDCYEDQQEEGFRRKVTTDSDGNPIVKIMNGETEVEWWRVEETEVY